MAHADYACCILCDAKVYYCADSYPKTELCSRCAANLSLKAGKPIYSAEDFLSWFRLGDDVLKIIDELGYKPCLYGSEFDERVADLRKI